MQIVQRPTAVTVHNSSDCCVSISGSGSGASFLANPKKTGTEPRCAGSLEPWNLLVAKLD